MSTYVPRLTDRVETIFLCARQLSLAEIEFYCDCAVDLEVFFFCGTKKTSYKFIKLVLWY